MIRRLATWLRDAQWDEIVLFVVLAVGTIVFVVQLAHG